MGQYTYLVGLFVVVAIMGAAGLIAAAKERREREAHKHDGRHDSAAPAQ